MKWTLAGASISFGRPDGTDGGHDGGGCGAADRPHFRVVVAFRRPRTAHEEPAPTASATASDAGIRTGTFRSSPRARARGLMTLGNDNAVLPAPARPSRHESHPVRSRDSRRQDRSTCWKFHRGCIGAGRGCTNSVVMRWVGLTISNSDFPSSCQDPKPCSANRSGARSSASPLA
jgi:hypothetical protein